MTHPLSIFAERLKKELTRSLKVESSNLTIEVHSLDDIRISVIFDASDQDRMSINRHVQDLLSQRGFHIGGIAKDALMSSFSVSCYTVVASNFL